MSHQPDHRTPTTSATTPVTGGDRATPPAPSTPTRRVFGRGLLLGGAAAGVAAVAGPSAANASTEAATTPWKQGGNTVASGDYLGVTNGQPLIFKVAQTAGSPVERARFRPTGELVVKGPTSIGTDPAPGIRLNVAQSVTTGTAINATAPNSLSSALGAVAIKGTGTVGVNGVGEYMGVVGTSTNYAVFGYTNPDTQGIGVYGRGYQGVKGRSYSGYAVYGDTDSGVGVRGEAYSDGSTVNAIEGVCFGANGNGVVATANNGTAAYAIWGTSTNGYAGFFSGKVNVTGTLSKGGGSFKIDHPLDPENKYLYHSFVESPDMMNVYNGNVTTDAAGRATVKLPDYFGALNRDYRYQLTVIGAFAQAIVSREVADNAFEVHTDKPSVKVSWQVTGIRKDAFANAHRIPVVEEKSTQERGTYLHPQAFGKSATLDVMHARTQGMAKHDEPRGVDPVAPA